MLLQTHKTHVMISCSNPANKNMLKSAIEALRKGKKYVQN